MKANVFIQVLSFGPIVFLASMDTSIRLSNLLNVCTKSAKGRTGNGIAKYSTQWQQNRCEEILFK